MYICAFVYQEEDFQDLGKERGEKLKFKIHWERLVM